MNVKEQLISVVLPQGGTLQIEVQSQEQQPETEASTITKELSSEGVKQWRKSKKYTQKQLADALGVRIAAVARWEQQARPVPPYLWLALLGLELTEGK